MKETSDSTEVDGKPLFKFKVQNPNVPIQDTNSMTALLLTTATVAGVFDGDCALSLVCLPQLHRDATG